eukprot:403375671
MRNLLRPEEQLFQRRLPKKLEFGHTLVAQYKKHIGGAVKSIFWNPNTKQVIKNLDLIVLSRAYVSYNEKNLHVWKPETEEQIFFLYLAISNDFKLHIFNEHLHHIKALPLKIRLINFAYFYEKESKLITAGIDGCFMFEFQMICKYEPKQAVLLDPEGNTMEFKLGPKIKLEKMPLWVKGLKVDEKEGIIFTWSQLKTCFNDISTGKIQFKFKSLTTYEDYITDLILSDEFRYFITSTYFGHIFVWKLINHRKLIHSFGGHTKTVTSLSNHPTQPTLFISASNDNTIRIWCLDKFQELYCFELLAGINNIKMMNERIFACFYNDAIKIGELHHLALSFTNQGSAIAEGKSITQQITSMAFASSTPPRYDCEIFNEINVGLNKEEDRVYDEQSYVDFSDKYLVFGLSKGTVVFISVDNLELIYSRFSIHRQAIEQIYEIKQYHKMVTLCQELSFNIYRPIGDIKICNNLIFIGFKTGDTEMFLWDENPVAGNANEKELYRLSCDKIDEHEDELQSLDFLPKHSVYKDRYKEEEYGLQHKFNSGLFVTGAKDGLVKVWNIKKELIREIKFPEPITSVCFLNQNADLLVGHVGKVSTVLAKDYKPFEVEDLALPPQEEIAQFMRDKVVVTENIFKKLKLQDDKIKRQYQDIIKKSPKKLQSNKFHQDLKDLQDPLQDQINEGQATGRMNSNKSPENSFAKNKKHPKFKDDTTISEIMQGADMDYQNDSPKNKGQRGGQDQYSDSDDENVFDEEIYKKALEAAKVDQEKRAAKRLQTMQKRNHNGPEGDQGGQMLKKKKAAVTTIKRVEYNSFQNQNSYLDNKANTSSIQNYPYGSVGGNQGGFTFILSSQPPPDPKLIEKLSQPSIHEILDKYKPGKVTALPPMMNHQASQMSLLRQLQNKTNMTRRDITEGKIISNILMHNDPREIQQYDDIFISTRNDQDIFGNQSFIAKTLGQNSGQKNGQQQFLQQQQNSISIMSGSQKYGSASKQKRNYTHSLPRILGNGERGRNQNMLRNQQTSNLGGSIFDTKFSQPPIQYQSIQLSNNGGNVSNDLYGLGIAAQSQNSQNMQQYMTQQPSNAVKSDLELFKDKMMSQEQLFINNLPLPTAETLPSQGISNGANIRSKSNATSNLRNNRTKVYGKRIQ